MLRPILGVLAGVIASVATVLGLETVTHSIYPPPPGLDATRMADAARIVAAMPMPAKVLVIVGWFLGTLFGGLIANRIVGARWPGWVIAGLGAAGGIFSVMSIPHPLFMQVGAVAAPLIAAAIASALSPAGREPPAAPARLSGSR